MSLTREEVLQLITEVLPGLLEPVTAQLLGDVKTLYVSNRDLNRITFTHI